MYSALHQVVYAAVIYVSALTSLRTSPYTISKWFVPENVHVCAVL